MLRILAAVLLSLALTACATTSEQTPADPNKPGPVKGWLSWRGPTQDGVSVEKGLPDTLSTEGASMLWGYPLAGRGTPVVAGERVYAIGYRGAGPELKEVVAAIDARTGQRVWEVGFSDFLSDIIYERYSIGAPAVDPATGYIYALTSPGVLVALAPNGDLLWEVSMMESFGRLTFPNGRTGAPVVWGDLIVLHAITSNWGRSGPARDRFYAFDKTTGELAWASTPGVRPIDSSFSTPVVADEAGRPVLYAGTGCGNLVAVSAVDGAPVWRYQMSDGGVNATVALGEDGRVFAVHGKENLDSTRTGRMVALEPGAPTGEPVVLDAAAERWRADVRSFTSSPVRVGDRVYVVTTTGDLVALDAATGATTGELKLGAEQLHASPTYGDGKLYVPLADGVLHVVKLGPDGMEEVSQVALEGAALGAPAIWAGRIYVHTTARLYAFGKVGAAPSVSAPMPAAPKPGTATRLTVRPAEVHLMPGSARALTLQPVDEAGVPVGEPSRTGWTFEDSDSAGLLRLSIDDSGQLAAGEDATPAAAVLTLRVGELEGPLRVRIAPKPGWSMDFEDIALMPHPKKDGVPFAHPPRPWTSARLKWEVRERDGGQVLAKTLDRVLFQRSTTFIGHPDMAGYTLSADVLTDGNRRLMGAIGVVNQRYILSIDGNKQRLEVHSNYDRVHDGVPFEVKPEVWYRLETRVDVGEDGVAVVRARAWPREEEPPDGWLLEYRHQAGHAHGAPGLYGFSPQSQVRVYIDNVALSSSKQL